MNTSSFEASLSDKVISLDEMSVATVCWRYNSSDIYILV